MKTTNYICDKCKKSVSEKDLCSLSVSISNLKISYDGQYSRNHKIDICKECLKNYGFHIDIDIKENVEEIRTQNDKTLENKIIDILKKLDVAFLDDLQNY